MKITLEHKEIEQALVAYIGSQGITIAGKDIDVNMTAGRGNNGYTASISINEGKSAKLESISTDASADTAEDIAKADDEEVADDTSLFAS